MGEIRLHLDGKQAVNLPDNKRVGHAAQPFLLWSRPLGGGVPGGLGPFMPGGAVGKVRVDMDNGVGHLMMIQQKRANLAGDGVTVSHG